MMLEKTNKGLVAFFDLVNGLEFSYKKASFNKKYVCSVAINARKLALYRRVKKSII